MHVLFVVLMGMLIGASAIPNLLQGNNKSAYSKRKAQAFALLSVPKLEAKDKKAQDEKLNEAHPIDGLEQSQPVEQASSQSSSEQSLSETAKLSASSSSLDEFDRELASYVGPSGTMMIDDADLKSCVCQGEKYMQCKLWLEGSCSDVDDYVRVVARSPASTEFRKNLRCKSDNRFSGFMTVYGDQSLRMQIRYRDKIYKKDFSLTNHCGSLQKLNSFGED